MLLSVRASARFLSRGARQLSICAALIALTPGCVGAITGDAADDDGDGPGGSDGSSGGDDGSSGADDGGGAGGGDDGSGDDDGGTVLPELPSEGAVKVTLHPGPAAVIGSPTIVSFGAPFPRGVLADVGLLRARAGDAELPLHAAALLPWRVWPGRSDATESIRAAMVSVEVTFSSQGPLEIELEYGAAPTATLAAQADPRADWVAVTDGEYPAGTVREPAVYAAFPPGWLGDCALRTRTAAVGLDPDMAWMDAATVGFAATAVNDLPDSVDDHIDYLGDAEAWLFDRTATLFNVYARTGDVKWLRHAHRSAQFYRGLIGADGYFALKPGDLKYSYGRSLLIDFVFTGDPALLDSIERIAGAGDEWDPTYDIGTNFWTERHQTYALLASLAAWEATGEPAHAARTRDIVEVSFALASSPVESWQDNGCMLHGMTAHEGAGGDVPICSPWMSALFADAVWEYYVHTDDGAALDFLADLGRFTADYGVYGTDEIDGGPFLVPWYLSSSEMQFSDEGPFGDVEHTCDVGGMVMRAAWAERERGGDPSSLRDTAEELIRACEFNLDSWHRPNGPASGLSEWRLSPARKFNWWFGTTSDLGWLLAALDRG
jgi:hypothetical protein